MARASICLSGVSARPGGSRCSGSVWQVSPLMTVLVPLD